VPLDMVPPCGSLATPGRRASVGKPWSPPAGRLSPSYACPLHLAPRGVEKVSCPFRLGAPALTPQKANVAAVAPGAAAGIGALLLGLLLYHGALPAQVVWCHHFGYGYAKPQEQRPGGVSPRHAQ